MTKPITASAIMILVKEGRIRLSDPVSKYLSEWAKVRVIPPGAIKPGSDIMHAETDRCGAANYDSGSAYPHRGIARF